MLMTIGIIVVALIAVVLVIAAVRPAAFRVERRASIRAPAAAVHAYLADFHRWAAWSPWEHIDPTMQRTFSGAPSGKGAVYEWRGDGKAGAGRMQILDAPAPQRVAIQLDFIKPFAARNTTEFTLVPQGDTTDVQWEMHGTSPFLMRVMGLFVSMDRMVGKDFEAGLAKLKAVTEGPETADQPR